MKTKNSTGRLPGSKGRSRKLLLASIMMIALSATSCRSTKMPTLTHEAAGDTLQERRSAQLTLMPVPLSRTTMELPLPQLQNLPLGASYSSQDGQSRLSVTRSRGDTLVLTATCDSLARQVIFLTEELTHARSKREAEQKLPPASRSPTGWQWFWIRLGQLSAIVMLIAAARTGIRKRLGAGK